MELHLNVIGTFSIVLAVAHLIFPEYFKWKQELRSLSIINRQLMYVHSFFIAFAVFLIGLLCLTSANELVNTSLGKRISLGIGIFWAVRLWVQFFGFSIKTWIGKSFETTVHVMMSLWWIYLSAVFLLIFFI